MDSGKLLLIIGLGYTGRAIARAAAAAGIPVRITSRTTSGTQADGLEVVDFAGAQAAIAAAAGIVSTAPPAGDGGDAGEAVDPVLAAYGPAIEAAPYLRWIGYLSTTGVYGDQAGGWVDETTPPTPGQPRSRRRLAAEQAWIEAGRGDRAVDIMRVAGIYGPGRSPFDDLRAGRARRIDKPGHAFGRIHRDDIAAAVVAAFRQIRPPGARVLNLTDDQPAPQSDVVAEAAGLLGMQPPPLIPFADAARGMSDMGRSFWSENRRVRAEATQAALGLRWRYPSYREGLRAILAEETGQDSPEQRKVGGT